MATDGKIHIQADLVPNNDNPRMPVTDVKYIKGAGQTFQDIAELVAFHPNKMSLGMPCTVMNWPSAGVITDFRLSIDPAQMVDANGDSLVTSDSFLTFWTVQSQVTRSSTRVYQYAPNGPGGGTPVYPYTIGEEPNWSNTLDESKGHKWLRFRDDDVDDNADGIFDNWSVPIGIGAQFQTGDYVENRFKRQAVSGTVFSSPTGMVTGNYYVVESGTITLNGVLADSDIDWIGSGTSTILTVGKVFKHAGTVALTFNTATAIETLKTPPRTVGGVANNEPAGWSDTIPGGTDQLWSITAQKSVYGQLKTPWSLKKINESPDFIRYSDSPSPHPDTIAGINTPATTGSGGDTNLIAAGWVSVYDNQNFIATRELDPGPDLYTPWLVQKINEESGEYVDRVYKLFDMNLDPGSPFLAPPTSADATQDGWSDTPLQETSTQINYESQARKFFDGTLKTAWTAPVPYTGRDTIIDTIETTLGDNFKYDADGNVAPAEITLQANLYKGVAKLWEDAAVTISYAWERVYNNGAVDTTTPTSNPADPFYKLGAASPIRADQRVVVKAAAVTGLAVFRCTQTITLPEGDPLVFEEEFTVLDITDGIDAKNLSVTADNDRTVYDTTNLVFVPATITMRAYMSNLGAPTLYWYRWNGSAWVTLTGDPYYTLSGNNASFPAGTSVAATALVASTQYMITFVGTTDFTLVGAASNTVGLVFTASGAGTGTGTAAPTSDVFASDGSAEEQRYAVSTHATDPAAADFISTFSDYITIVKLGAASTGVPGADAISILLNNESHTVVLDQATLQPLSGEAGSSGKAITKIELWDGATKKDYTTHWTITGITSSEGADITFSHQANGTDRDVYVGTTWANGKRSAVATISILYNAVTYTKKFSISSTADATGAILVDIDSDKGYVFTPTDKTDKIFTAKIYDASLPAASQLISSITAGNFVVGKSYVILTAGTTDFTLIGSANNTPGTTFTATGAGTGTGTAIESIWTFRWNVNNSWGTTTSLNVNKTVTRADVLTYSKVILEVYKSAVLFRSLTINVTDVNDGKSYRAWTDNVTKPTGSQDLSSQDPTPTDPPGDFGVSGDDPVTVGGVDWYLPSATYWATHTPTFAQDAEEVGGAYTWGAVYQLKGEAGSQGPSGNFFHPMYIKSATAPAFGAGGSTSTLAQMKTAGWRSKISDLVGTDPIWRTERLWTGQGVTFDANLDPSTGPVSGGAWSEATKISGTTGATGPTGPTEYDTVNASLGISGGGLVTWDSWGASVTWSQAVVVSPVNTSFGSDGYFTIGPTTVSLAADEALFYAPPRGSGNAFNPSYFKKKKYNDIQIIGDTWIFICFHHGATSSLRWNPGLVTLPYDSNAGIATFNTQTGVCSWLAPSSPLKWITIDIGTWNMDSTTPKVVNHGITGGYSRIKVVEVMIRNDNNTNSIPLNATDSAGWISDVSDVAITLQRTASGAFDNVNYDLTAGSYNRGWITIGYI